MLRLAGTLVLLLLAQPAVAGDSRAVITGQFQDLYDAVASGDAKLWERLLDPASVYVSEGGTVSSKAEIVKEITGLPKGITGAIRAELLRYHEEASLAFAVFRAHETETYFGQVLQPVTYLITTTWVKRGDGWKVLVQQVLAELIDPPAIALSAARAKEYAGTYRLKGGDVLYEIAADGATLTGGRDGGSRSALNEEAADVFFTAGQPRIRKIFQRDGAGAITGFVDRREGRDVVWMKVQ
ncbi:MAG: nuclear transport factor 2 family protein [Alphaproteobacteria bacterium]